MIATASGLAIETETETASGLVIAKVIMVMAVQGHDMAPRGAANMSSAAAMAQVTAEAAQDGAPAETTATKTTSVAAMARVRAMAAGSAAADMAVAMIRNALVGARAMAGVALADGRQIMIASAIQALPTMSSAVTVGPEQASNMEVRAGTGLPVAMVGATVVITAVMEQKATEDTAERVIRVEANAIAITTVENLAAGIGDGGIAPATRSLHGSAMKRLHGGAKWTNAARDNIADAGQEVIAARTIA
jgi:hypothetical protein